MYPELFFNNICMKLKLSLSSQDLNKTSCQDIPKMCEIEIIICNFLIVGTQQKERQHRIILGKRQSVITYRASICFLEVKKKEGKKEGRTQSSCTTQKRKWKQ